MALSTSSTMRLTEMALRRAVTKWSDPDRIAQVDSGQGRTHDRRDQGAPPEDRRPPGALPEVQKEADHDGRSAMLLYHRRCLSGSVPPGSPRRARAQWGKCLMNQLSRLRVFSGRRFEG